MVIPVEICVLYVDRFFIFRKITFYSFALFLFVRGSTPLFLLHMCLTFSQELNSFSLLLDWKWQYTGLIPYTLNIFFFHLFPDGMACTELKVPTRLRLPGQKGAMLRMHQDNQECTR